MLATLRQGVVVLRQILLLLTCGASLDYHPPRDGFIGVAGGHHHPRVVVAQTLRPRASVHTGSR
ncbi:hypothetical protein AKJ09_08701 [Labilithrix luteola]|uniref:Uncharacterized protein n=1 Tax=Labilithrix luteola TaxID=1391654 RepID=A0A0K1Q8G8_9BACT|nr:hypothetical protein AKJ09_08701 [Labilithrix luteola]